jgi:hypothetical protein
MLDGKVQQTQKWMSISSSENRYAVIGGLGLWLWLSTLSAEYAPTVIDCGNGAPQASPCSM